MTEKKFVAGTVVENKHWTENLYSIKVDAKINDFIPGQFGRLALDINGKKIARPYSFVNGPQEPFHEFYSILVPGGILSQHLYRLKADDQVWIAPSAAGFFTLNEVPAGENLWMLSTGTAIGPFLSILKTDAPWAQFKHIVLVHAVRYAKELTYKDTIKNFIKQYAEQFTMIPFVSRENTDFAIKNRVPATIESGELEEKTGIALNQKISQVMICGNPDMVRDTTETLKQRGFIKNRRRDPGNITTENYW